MRKCDRNRKVKGTLLQRGDIYYADLNEVHEQSCGSEQRQK